MNTMTRMNRTMLAATALFALALGGGMLAMTVRAAGPADEAPTSGPVVTDKEIAGLIGLLGDESYQVREAAMKKLIEIGKPAESAVLRALRDTTDPETASRLRQLAPQLDPNVRRAAEIEAEAQRQLAAWSSQQAAAFRNADTAVAMKTLDPASVGLEQAAQLLAAAAAGQSAPSLSEEYRQRADRLRSMAAKTRTLVGAVFLKAGRAQEAITQFSRALQIPCADPALVAEASYWRADAQFKMGRLAEAKGGFESLIWDHPGQKWAKFARGRLVDPKLAAVEANPAKPQAPAEGAQPASAPAGPADLVKGQKVLLAFHAYPVGKPGLGQDNPAARKKVADDIQAALTKAGVKVVKVIRADDPTPRSIHFNQTLLLDCGGKDAAAALADVPHRTHGIVFRDGAYVRGLPGPQDAHRAEPMAVAYRAWGTGMLGRPDPRPNLAQLRAMPTVHVDYVRPAMGSGGSLGYALLTPEGTTTLLEVFLAAQADFLPGLFDPQTRLRVGIRGAGTEVFAVGRGRKTVVWSAKLSGAPARRLVIDGENLVILPGKRTLNLRTGP